MGRFFLGYILGTISMAAVVGYLPTGQAEKIVKQYSIAGYALVKELAGE